jgi:hypothetical protein
MANKIRRLLIGAEVKQQFSYNVGGSQDVYIEGSPKKITIHSIDELEKYYIVNVGVGDEVQEWKKIPKNDITTVEYYID